MHRHRYKRLYDLTALLVVYLPFLPLWLALLLSIILAIKLQDGGPVFFKQTRVGRNGRHFRMWKFRTMVADAERDTGPVRAVRGDCRVTPLGRWLRVTHLDELPQTINILKGDMSIVGPRPERPELAERFAREHPDFHRRTTVKPGIASPSMYHGDSYSDIGLRLQHDLRYIETMSPWEDTRTITRCVWATLCRTRDELTQPSRDRRPAG